MYRTTSTNRKLSDLRTVFASLLIFATLLPGIAPAQSTTTGDGSRPPVEIEIEDNSDPGITPTAIGDPVRAPRNLKQDDNLVAPLAGVDVTAPGDPIVGVSATPGSATSIAGISGVDFPTFETPPNAIDNQPTKYLNFGETNVGFVITPSAASKVTGIRFTTASDAPERDPLTVVLEGTNSPNATTTLNSTWTTLYSGVTGLAADPGRLGVGPEITFSNATSYSSYRLLVTSVRNPATANSMSFAEVELTEVPPCPANPVVTNTNDSGAGSLRQAVADACPDGTITFAPAVTPTIALTSGQISIDKNLTIQGPGASVLNIQNTAAPSATSRVFFINANVTANINNVRISGGNMAGGNHGAGIYNDGGTLNLNNSVVAGNQIFNSSSPFNFGGGIYNLSGTLNLTNSTVASNIVLGVFQTNNFGGGIFNGPTAHANLVGTTVSNNTAYGTSLSSERGGGIYNDGGTLTVTNSTVSANITNSGGAGGKGSGIYDTGAMKLTNSTVTGNSSLGQNFNNGPGGVYTEGGATVRNTIIAGNNVPPGPFSPGFGPDVSGIFNSLGNNLIGKTNDSSGWIASDITGTIASPVDPMLGPLANNGGPTLTHALLPGSQAYNDGSDCVFDDTCTPNLGFPLTTDQRGAGFSRKVGSHVDIGAYEVQLDTTPPVITPTVTGTLGNNGWYTSNVQVSWSVTDPETAIAPQNGCDTQNVTADTASVTLTCTATSFGGTSSQSVFVKRDATAPTITFASQTPPPNAAGWNNSNVTVAWTCADTLSGPVATNVSTLVNAQGSNLSAAGTCTDLAGNAASNTQTGIKIDKTAPTITFASRTPAPNAAGWNNANVTVNWTCADSLSGAVNATTSQLITAEGASLSATGTCSDVAGNSASNTQSGIKIDKTAPTLAPTVSPNPVILGSLATASPNGSDGLSGIASQSCGPVVTSSVGPQSVACTATDVAGNTASANAGYQVIYAFTGFSGRVQNAPAVNYAAAGNTIPLSFRLNGDQGLNIFASGSPSSQQVNCLTGTAIGGSTVNVGNLVYWAGTYTYYWDTNGAWRGTCRQFSMAMNDGTTKTLSFSFYN